MLVFRTQDNKNMELTAITVTSAKSLPKFMAENPDKFEDGWDYYPVKVGRGLRKSTETIIKGKEVKLG